ncbi:MAG: type I-F CRISPR-associated helicase Cas3f, partial [Methylococcaceae bacterium]
LDAFANRIGSRTWQTVITQEGLQAVKKLLRHTASKNTAVSCHWQRSRSRSELVWIVGNRNKFNIQGYVPVNYTQKELLKTQWENDWHYLPLIKSLTALAALFHDWGKASICFQDKLNPKKKQPLSDPLRHEWVSLLLLTAFINSEKNDAEWLKRLANGEINETAIIQQLASHRLEKPMTDLPNAAGLLAWLIVSHHKLPINWQQAEEWQDESAKTLQITLKRITAEWGYQNPKELQRLTSCFNFPQGLPSQSQQWLKQLKKWATKLQQCLPQLEQAIEEGSWRVVLHHARLALMLGDHYYSSQPADSHWQTNLALFANTDPKSKQLKQKLDEHLVGVMKSALNTAHLLPAFETEPPQAFDIKPLKQKSQASKFRWQDVAVEKVKRWKTEKHLTQHFGFFTVNMASTGCGKTLANAKLMQALSANSDSLRYTLALGLRTLTLQTGDEYRERIGLDDSELAVLIGSQAVIDLHQQNVTSLAKQQAEQREQVGSESAEELLQDNEVIFDCAIPTDGFVTVLPDNRSRKFLYAPVLVCTIDHLMAAVETLRGGAYILPSLRLLSADLVIDEIDDFDGSDLIAIGRLIHLAGLLGRKVMISSATIPPALAEGYFNAYQTGWQSFAKTRDVSPIIGCAWSDEFTTQVNTLNLDAPISEYQQAHQDFIQQRAVKLKQQPIKRKAEIIPLVKPTTANAETLKQSFHSAIQQAIIQLHQRHHQIDPITQKKVSFGVVRIANITPCIEVTEFLAETQWSEQIEVRVMAYHSQQVLLMRSAQERHLDAVLKRQDTAKVFQNSVIRQHLDTALSENVLFILVATPVEEVGRDHDFDWAVIEPSSMRSIIQLAGRVLRHRDIQPDSANIAVLQRNLKSLMQAEDSIAYCLPGYESKKHPLQSHTINELIPSEQLNAINALARIQANSALQPTIRLADLEHHCIQELLTTYHDISASALQGWLQGYWCLTALPQYFNRFRNNEKQQVLYLVANDKQEWQFVEKDNQGQTNPIEQRYQIDHFDLTEREQSRWWLWRDYQTLLEQIAEQKELTLEKAALRYGEISTRITDADVLNRCQFAYCEQLGMWKIH